MDWQEQYAAKIATLKQAVKAIPKGRRILIGSGAAEPSRLVEAMVSHGDHLFDNEIVHLLTLGPAPYVAPGLEHRFRHTAFFIGNNVRQAVQEGRADFMPVFLSEIPELIKSRRVRIDVALIQVSPPDRHGYVSLGVSVDIVRAAVDNADIILAEVNPRMPRTLGDSFLHVSKIMHLVPVDEALPERIPEPLDVVFQQIGWNVASLIPDGATLQMGIGKIPDAVLAALTDRKELGIHTEMLSDGVMNLVEAGVITGKRKTLLPGKVVTSFVMGTRKLYDWVHDNPIVEMRPSHFTNDPFTIARNDRMVAINAALAVDLTGQVAADTLMGRFFSGIGGQVDFIRGAARSRGGKPIIGIQSTAKGGEVSRIQPALEEGAGVVTSRGDVHYVVTEWGVADLWGKNIRQRAQALIDIAHPDHKADLHAAACKRRYIFVPAVEKRPLHPWEEERAERLPGGEEVRIRPVQMNDEMPLREIFMREGDERIYRRFLALRNIDPHEEMKLLADLDYEKTRAIVVTAKTESGETIVGLSRYDVDPATHLADIAFVVREEWRGKGVGTSMMKRMGEIAKALGLAGFTSVVAADNKPLMMTFYRSGLSLSGDLARGVYNLTARFDTTAREESPFEKVGKVLVDSSM